MPQLFFHTGQLFAKAATANATPQSFGTLQNVSVDFANTTKELFGQFNYASAIGQGPTKITGKAASAQIQARLFNDIFVNGTLSAGETVLAPREAASVPTTPFTITVANAATHVEDWEVLDATTGLPLIKVASAPAAGQYSVNAATGVYTFAAADTGKAVFISYTYTVASSGQTLKGRQQLVGPAPTFSLLLGGGYGPAGTTLPGLKLYACVAQKLGFATKQNDFAIPQFEFMAMADSAGNVFDWSTNDKAG